jgi:hypothetical protein
MTPSFSQVLYESSVDHLTHGLLFRPSLLLRKGFPFIDRKEPTKMMLYTQVFVDCLSYIHTVLTAHKTSQRS